MAKQVRNDLDRDKNMSGIMSAKVPRASSAIEGTLRGEVEGNSYDIGETEVFKAQHK